MLKYSAREGDVTQVACDALLLKYPQRHYGIEARMGASLVEPGLCAWEDVRPAVNQHRLVPTGGKLPQRYVLFVGTPPLEKIGYPEMYALAFHAVEALASHGVTAARVATTIHRGSAGLDLGETLQSLVRGFEDGCRTWPKARLENVEFVERDSRRAAFISSLLTQEGSQSAPATLADQGLGAVATSVSPFGTVIAGTGRRKQHVFVAMPFSEQFEDVYELGIYPALRECGYICERLDRSAFTGDILHRMKDRIRTARFVLADLSEARPNVYLEVGYAWGQDVPVLFIAREAEKLHFDVSTHRCLFYTSIRQLKRELEVAARELGRA